MNIPLTLKRNFEFYWQTSENRQKCQITSADLDMDPSPGWTKTLTQTQSGIQTDRMHFVFSA